MQDILIAILISWILFRLFRPVIFVQWSGRRNASTYDHAANRSPEGEIKVSKPHSHHKSTHDSGEYVDFEELPSNSHDRTVS